MKSVVIVFVLLVLGSSFSVIAITPEDPGVHQSQVSFPFVPEKLKTGYLREAVSAQEEINAIEQKETSGNIIKPKLPAQHKKLNDYKFEEKSIPVQSSELIATTNDNIPQEHYAIGSQEDDGRIIVISNETNVLLAQELIDGTLITLPPGVKNGETITIYGQLVDGNYTPLSQTNNGTKNNGIADANIDVTWEGGKISLMGGNPQQSLTISTYTYPISPFPNGTFFFDLLADKSPAGIYNLTFVFGGKPVRIDGTDYLVYPPKTAVFQIAVMHEPYINLNVEPMPVVVGNILKVSGIVTEDKSVEEWGGKENAIKVKNARLELSFDTMIIGEPMPAGWYIDDIVVIMSGIPVFDDSLETTDTPLKWSHGDIKGRLGMDEWEWGIPKFGPENAHSPYKVWGTDLDGSYERLAHCWLKSPPINLSTDLPGTQTVKLSFWHWYDVTLYESLLVEVSNDNGISWVVIGNYTGTKKSWDMEEIDLTLLKDKNGQDYQVGGREKVIFKFTLISDAPSTVTNENGEFSVEYRIPNETTPDDHKVNAIHRASLLYTDGNRTVIVKVRRLTHFVFPTDETKKICFRNSQVTFSAQLLDNMDEVPKDPLINNYLVKVSVDPTPLDPTDYPRPAGQKPINNKGWMEVSYSVTKDQDIGLINVIFEYTPKEADYYNASKGIDNYTVKAHTKFIVVPEKNETRGKTIVLSGRLVIEPNESRIYQDTGDPVPYREDDEIKIFWGDKEVGTTGTDKYGNFEKKYRIELTHPLGLVIVKFLFEKTEEYEESSFLAKYYIRSNLTITIVERVVYKGEKTNISGTVVDDIGAGVSHIVLKLEKIWLGAPVVLSKNVVTGAGGTFYYPLKISVQDDVGNITIRASYYNPEDYRYFPSNGSANFTIKAITKLLREDSTLETIRDRELITQGKLVEYWGKDIYGDDWLGNVVKDARVDVYLDDRFLTPGKTMDDGTFTVKPMVSSDVDVGKHKLIFLFAGTEFYDSSVNETEIYVKAATIVSFIDLNPNRTLVRDERYEKDVVLRGAVMLEDDNRKVLFNQTIWVYYVLEDQNATAVFEYLKTNIEMGVHPKDIPENLIGIGTLDITGRFKFDYTFPKYSEKKNITIYAKFDGYYITTPNGTKVEIYMPSESSKILNYKIIKMEILPPWALWIAIAIICITAVAVSVYVANVLKRRAELRLMQTIIRRAADQLVAGNEYAAVIFKAYRQLARNLRKYGHLRRDSETFREFEAAIRTALPIDRKSMDDFLGVLEETRYSDHEIGEMQRDKAIAALRSVQFSLEKIILTEAQLA
ncbi:MAG: DUF4129 domain-containing protein, partial [Candidatus Thermoplasmatota archaeon]